jgi:RNA recognition motif-containing protein
LFIESREILSNANVFVSYLPADVTEKEFEELFQKFGEIISCKLLDGGFSFRILFFDILIAYLFILDPLDKIKHPNPVNPKFKYRNGIFFFLYFFFFFF